MHVLGTDLTNRRTLEELALVDPTFSHVLSPKQQLGKICRDCSYKLDEDNSYGICVLRERGNYEEVAHNSYLKYDFECLGCSILSFGYLSPRTEACEMRWSRRTLSQMSEDVLLLIGYLGLLIVCINPLAF